MERSTGTDRSQHSRYGVVTLTGEVNPRDAVKKIGEIAKSVNGVKAVNNKLVVKQAGIARDARGCLIDVGEGERRRDLRRGRADMVFRHVGRPARRHGP